MAFALAAAVAKAQPATAEPESPRVTLPAPRGTTGVVYPEGASGDARVVLELLIAADGRVADVRVVSGEAPFADAARVAAKTWTFEPATRDGAPMAARIRFEVRFVEPPPEPEQPVVAPPAAAPAPVAPGPPAAIEVTVEGEKPPPARRSMPRAEVRQLPGAFGDPFRAIEAMPGVTPIISGIPYFFVRGAPPGNVGYYLDGIRVPLLYHVGLGPSVVHPAIVDRVDLYAGGYPARFGRYAGGIVSGETTSPAAELHGEASVRLLDAGALVEAPVLDGRGTVAVGGRYSYTFLLISLLAPDAVLEYWDYQARASLDVTARDTFSVFSFGSYDFLGEKQDGQTKVGLATEFHRVDFRWDHRASARTDLRLAVALGMDRTRVGDEELYLRDRLVHVRSELRHRASKQVTLRGGVDTAIDYYDVVANFDVSEDDVDPKDQEQFDRLFPTRTDVVSGAWAEVVWQPESWVTVTPGVRADLYTSDGASALALEPRLAARFEVTERWRLLHTFGVAHQPPGFFVPVPGFQLAGLQGGLQRSLQSSAGVETDLDWDVTTSVTLFHNVFLNMTDPLGASARNQGNDENENIDPRSQGRAVGVEVMARRSLTKRLGGFLSYTLSRSTRSIGREKFPSAFDRTHVLNFALGYDLGRRWRAGTRLVWYTGFPRRGDDDALRSSSPERIPSFYRIDARLEKRWRLGKTGYWAFVAEMLNATLQKEVINVSCDASGCDEEEIGPISIPSLGVEAVF